MKILATGASGFIGGHVVKLLVEKGHEVIAGSRKKMTVHPQGWRWRLLPSLDPGSDWTGLLDDIDCVVHCAGRVHVMQDKAIDPIAEFRRVNRDGTMALARAAASQGVQRFGFISPIKVSGEETLRGRPFSANDPPQPSCPYGISKLDAETALFQVGRQTEMEIAVVRPVLVYGPGVGANFRSLMQAVERGVPLPFGSTKNQRSLVFVGNLADLVGELCEHPAAPGNIFFVSDGEDLSTAHLIRKLAHAYGTKARLINIPPVLARLALRAIGKDTVAQRLLGSLTVDTKLTEERLGWKPIHSMEDGLARTVEAYRCPRVARR